MLLPSALEDQVLVQQVSGGLQQPPTCSSRSACTSHLPMASTRSGCAPRRASTLCFFVAVTASSTASCTLTLCSRRAKETTAPAVPQEQSFVSRELHVAGGMLRVMDILPHS